MLDGMERHLEVWRERERYEPVPKIEDVLKRAGVPIHLIVRHKAPLLRAEKIADAWESAPNAVTDPTTRLAYRQLIGQTNDLFRFVTRDMRIRVEYVDEEPYMTAQEQATDLRGRHLYTEWGMGNHHPLLDAEEYARFRAVHDVFGHAGIGRGFDRHGEYEAWLVHAGMYRGLGAWAMTSEYRGVNSSQCVGENAGTGKAALLPRELFPELVREGAILLDRPTPAVPRFGRGEMRVGDEVRVGKHNGRIVAESERGRFDVITDDERYLPNLAPRELTEGVVK